MDDQLLGRSVYRLGCDRPLAGPHWRRPDEWTTGDRGPDGPALRAGLPQVRRLLEADQDPSVADTARRSANR
jgi:hypothetical protein